MVGLQNLFQVRIVGLDQRPLLQLAEEVPHPERDHDHRYGRVFQDPKAEVQVSPGVGEVGLNQPKQVPAAGEDHDLADQNQALLVALQVAREQQGKGDEPVEYEIERGDHAPAAANTVEIPRNLFRQISRPNDEELGESQIDIQHDEGKSQFAQVVLLSFAQ